MEELGDLEKQVYVAFQKNLVDEVVNICENFHDGGLHICSIHKATILHLAIYHRKYKIAHKLLDGLNLLYRHENNNYLSEKLTSEVDKWGHTLLHCASVSDKSVGIAKRLLRLAPKLLEKYNRRGESPLFSACRHGQFDMFHYLAGQVDLYCSQNGGALRKDDFFHRLEDGINVLHLSVRRRTFDLALYIVERYPHLCKEKDPKGITALQMIACYRTAFRSGSTPKLGLLNKFLYKIISCMSEEFYNKQNHTWSIKENVFCKPFKSLRCVQKMIKLISNHMKALKLVQSLVKNDDTWKQTTTCEQDEPPKDDDVTRFKKITIEEEQQNALLIAAENGCIEIVIEILEEHPFAIEQFNEKQQNLLHLVIKNRQIDVFDYMKECHEDCVEWMIRDVDDDGNSILHMVGCLDSSQSSVDAKVVNPVTQLSRDLNLLEELKEKCPRSLSHHQNKMMQTADEMFSENSKKLQEDAKKWLENTTTQGIVVAGLIVTVVFAAIYQVPGGPNQEGIPNLLDKPFFHVFINTDVLSLASALTSIVLFLSIYTSSVELDQFRGSLNLKLLLSFGFLFLSVTMMMITFAATVILMILAEKRRWTKIIIYLVVFVPVTVLLFSFIPIYFQLVTNFSKWVRNKVNKYCAANKQDDEDQEPV